MVPQKDGGGVCAEGVGGDKIECQQLILLDRIGSFSIRQTRMNHARFMWNAKQYKAKFWLEPVRLELSGGFSRNEINRIQLIVEERRAEYMRKWNEYFID